MNCPSAVLVRPVRKDRTDHIMIMKFPIKKRMNSPSTVWGVPKSCDLLYDLYASCVFMDAIEVQAAHNHTNPPPKTQLRHEQKKRRLKESVKATVVFCFYHFWMGAHDENLILKTRKPQGLKVTQDVFVAEILMIHFF